MTPEELKAEQALEEAIKNVLVVRGYTDGLLMDWVVITAQHIVPNEDPDGSGATGHLMLTPHTQPAYRCDGLLDYGKMLVNRRYNRG
jgi:hypothetical protein